MGGGGVWQRAKLLHRLVLELPTGAESGLILPLIWTSFKGHGKSWKEDAELEEDAEWLAVSTLSFIK